MKYRLFLFFIFGMLLPKMMIGQENWNVTGTITDSMGSPISMATIFVTAADPTEKVLTFGTSDTLGYFNLIISSKITQVWLNIRYLGYKPIKKNVQNKEQNYIKFVLLPENNMLNEIIISSKPTVISVKDDTTRYRLAAFRDSTEYSIEDVLKKLPGLQVKENGQILFNGKPIEKLLVEGSDLFGRKYTIGTKNIRADFIDQVEVIEHYQENPMLKNLNMSDAVILNLKMSDKRKHILSGTLNVGLGYGEEMKGSLHANLFSISKKNKVIILSDNGNNGQQSDPSEMSATYDQIDNQDLKSDIHKTPGFVETPNLENPGLPAPYVINGISTFSTIRTEFTLKKDWSIILSGAWLQNQDLQYTSNEQFFLSDQSNYRLRTDRVLKNRKKLGDYDLYTAYFSKNKKHGFQGYAKLGLNISSSKQNLNEYRPSISYFYENSNGSRQKDILLNSLYSLRTGKKSIFQIMTKYQNTNQPQELSVENKDFASYFSVDSSYFHLNQNNDYRFRGAEITGKYTISLKRAIGALELKYADVLSKYFIDQNLMNTTNEEWRITSPNFQSIRSKGFQAETSLKYDINQTTFIKGQVQVVSRVLDTIFFNYSVAPSFKLFLTKYLIHLGEVRFGHTWTRTLPEPHNFLYTDYFSNPYLANRLYRSEPTTGHKFFFHYRNQEETKFRSYYAYFSYNFGEKSYRDDFRFYRSIQILQPYWANGNRLLNGNVNFEQFIPKIKTSLSINLSYNQEIGQYLVEQEPSKMINNLYGLRASIKYNFLRNAAQVSIRTANLRRVSRFSTNSSHSLNQFNNNNIQFGISYKKKKWRFSYNIDINKSQSKGQSSSIFLGSHAQFTRNIVLYGRKISIEGIFYNIGNTKSYNVVANDAYFNFSSSIEAVPRFFMLKLDTNL